MNGRAGCRLARSRPRCASSPRRCGRPRPRAADHLLQRAERLVQRRETAFERETGIKVTLTQKGSGETIAQIRAEAANPRGDVWWGGTGDPHLAGGRGRPHDTYRSPLLDELHPWARSSGSSRRTEDVGIYAGVLGFTYNTELLAKKKLAGRMLERPRQAEVQGRGPDLQPGLLRHRLYGDGDAGPGDGRGPGLRLSQEAACRNVNQYTRSGPAPARNAARGETDDRHHVPARCGRRGDRRDSR